VEKKKIAPMLAHENAPDHRLDIISNGQFAVNAVYLSKPNQCLWDQVIFNI
jgi:hypothetical protein